MGFVMSTTGGPFGLPGSAQVVNAHGPADAKRKKPKEPHAVWMPTSGRLVCLRCGDHYTPALPAPMRIMEVILRTFSAMHRRCRVDKARGIVCTHCCQFGHKFDACHQLQYAGDPVKWWNGPDTGMSSKVLCMFMTGWKHLDDGSLKLNNGRWRVPHDADDFGRAHRFLKAFPEHRPRVAEVMGAVPGWEKLAANWDEMERLYEIELPTGYCPQLFALMQTLV